MKKWGYHILFFFTDQERVDFDSLRKLAAADDSKDDADRPESRVQITEIDTTKIVRVFRFYEQ